MSELTLIQQHGINAGNFGGTRTEFDERAQNATWIQAGLVEALGGVLLHRTEKARTTRVICETPDMGLVNPLRAALLVPVDFHYLNPLGAYVPIGYKRTDEKGKRDAQMGEILVARVDHLGGLSGEGRTSLCDGFPFKTLGLSDLVSSAIRANLQIRGRELDQYGRTIQSYSPQRRIFEGYFYRFVRGHRPSRFNPPKFKGNPEDTNDLLRYYDRLEEIRANFADPDRHFGDKRMGAGPSNLDLEEYQVNTFLSEIASLFGKPDAFTQKPKTANNSSNRFFHFLTGIFGHRINS